jgi:outer membrane protein assembly factor BamA
VNRAITSALSHTRLVIMGAAAAMLLALIAVHAPPSRALVLRRAAEALRVPYGIDLRADSLSYNLLTLSAELRGIRVAAVQTPTEPFAIADALSMSFGVRTLIGDVSVKRLSIASPRIDIRRRGDGTDNLPRVNSGQSNGTSTRPVLPPIVVDNLDISFQQPATAAAIRGAAVQLTSAEGGRISARIEARHGATMTVGDRPIDLDTVAAIVDLGGERLDLRELTAARGDGALHASGSITLQGNASTVDISVNGWSELQSWWAATNDDAVPVGRVDATARVTGSLSDPAIAFETTCGSLAWSDVQVGDIRARGSYSGGELSLNAATLRFAGGTVDAHGEIVLDEAPRKSRIEVRWAEIDARHVPAAAGLGRTLSKSGTIVVEWRDGASGSPRFDITATTDVIASGRTIPVVVHGSGEGERWHVEASPRDGDAMNVTAIADIGLDARRWQASTIDGRIIGRAVTVAGLPRLDVDASFGVDVARKTSTGTFRLLAPGLDSATFAPPSDLALGGSLIAAGTWSGPLSDPAVDAILTARNLTMRRDGPVPITATDGAFDGVLKGSMTNPRGEGTLTIRALDIGGRGTGALTADLKVADGTARVDARAPDLKTTLDASIGLEAPNAFSGHATLTDYDIDALLGMAGLAGADPGAVRGRVSGVIAVEGNLRNLPSSTVRLDVAPIDATAFDVPIAMSRGLRASMTGNRVHLDDVAMTIGGLAVRLGGSLATDGSMGKLALDVDGDVSPLTPWLARLTGSDDVAAAGRLTGRLETETSPAGLVMTGTINTDAATLSKGSRVLAKDVRGALVVADGRAEIRDATGLVLGGRLAAAADAPLIWLNQWLPSAFQVARARIDRPAALAATASFEVPALLEFLGRTPMDTIGGGIELSATLSASTPDTAAIIGDLRLEHAAVTAKDLTYTQSEVTRVRLANGALTIESLDWRAPGSRILGRGSVGLVEGSETNLRLDVDTDLGIVGTLFSGRATGRLEGSIELSDQSGAVRVTSDATLSDASWLIPGQRILCAGWSGHIRLVDQELSVTKLGGTVNGGSIRVDGRLPLEASAASAGLTIAARDILIDVPRGLHSQLGADLVWRQAEGSAQLQGTVEITANRYTEPVTRILQFVNTLSSATRTSGESTLPPLLADTALDVRFAVTDPILIDNSVGTVELMPDLRLAGTLDSPALSGRVVVADDGRITIGGRAYRLRDSQVRFAPSDGLVPTVDAVGDTRIGDYDVTIRISGTPVRIDTSFSSVPPLGERELQSLIVTGQTGEQSTQNRQSDDNFAAAAAATDILGFAGRFVGLDTVRIGAADLDLVSKDVSTEQHLTVSKSLGSSFDLIFSDNLEEGSVTWVLVWKPTPVNEVRASSVEDGTRALEFRRSIVFGPGSPTGTTSVRRAASDQSRAIVDAVRITGAPGFSEKELSGKLELDAGDRFDVRRWIEDRHRLERFYLDRGYQRVRIASTRNEDGDHSHVSLTYAIERGPQTVIETTGDRLPGEVLDAMYEAWRGLPIADVVRTEFERIAREGLARRGYYRPVLQLEFPTETPDLARVTMHVARGPHTKALLVAWTGNRAVSTADLDALLVKHRAESTVWLDAQSIAWEVRQVYASRGYLQAQVAVGEPAFRNTEATLPIAIDEGVLSRLVHLQLNGVDPARIPGATEALALSIGEPFAASAPVDAARRLRAFYIGLGYRSAAVTHTLTTAKDGGVSLAWAVKEGPLYLVKDVSVEGADTTSGRLVRKAITLEPGDAMSQGAIDATRRNLYDIGSFRRVDFDFGDGAIQPGDPDDMPRTLTIQAEELQRFQLKYGVQFSFDRSSGKGGGTALGGSVELRDRNFIGRAVQASVGAHWDPDLQTIGLLLSLPRTLGKRVRTNVYARNRREQDVLDDTSVLAGATLDDRRRELTFEQRWRPASAWELVWGYNFASRRFLIDRDDQHVDTSGLLAGPVVSVILDRRDSPFDATRGLFHSSSFQFGVPSLGSDLGYVRYLLRQSYYQPLGKLTLAGSVRYGTIQDYSGVAPVSIIDLFFNAGGTNSVRGYPEDSLSAITLGGFALGGTDLLVLNGELRFPITKRLGGAAFVDAGNTFANIADIARGRLALGAGIGIRIRTPLAPFRLDVAHPFRNEYGRDGVRVHFSIGQMF